VLLICSVTGCSGSGTTTNSEPSKQEEALAKSLEQAFRAYHQGMTSDDEGEHAKAMAAWIGNRDDIKALFAKYPTTPDLYAMSLTLESGAEQYAAQEKNRGSIKTLKAVDARLEDTPVRDVLRVTPEDVPVFLLRVEYQNEVEPVSWAPVFQIKGRWVCMPGLEKMAPKFKEAGK
jgi:hypothetical protein